MAVDTKRHHARQSSSLLELPPELRNYIYELVLSSEPIELNYGQRFEPGLLQINRQVRAEPVQLFYTNSIFRTNDHLVAKKWLHIVPIDRRRMLKHVEIHTMDYGDRSEAERDPDVWLWAMRGLAQQLKRLVSGLGSGVLHYPVLNGEDEKVVYMPLERWAEELR